VGAQTPGNVSLPFVGKDGTMQSKKTHVLTVIAITTLIVLTGCNSELKNCQIQNKKQQARIDQLRSSFQAESLKLDKCDRKLQTAQSRCDAKTQSLQEKLAALQNDLAQKKELISSMQKQLLYGGARLPVELSTKLQDFAVANKNIVTYDENKGLVKFKSDLLFARGSDEVATNAKDTIKALCEILNSQEAKKFDIIIAGHTDDIPIRKAATKVEHPTNWHLSADRAIAVLDVIANSGLDFERMSIRGFSKYRPIAPNKPGNKGNAKNRRVEIYIVPKGT